MVAHGIIRIKIYTLNIKSENYIITTIRYKYQDYVSDVLVESDTFVKVMKHSLE
jgi:hypothetical protein